MGSVNNAVLALSATALLLSATVSCSDGDGPGGQGGAGDPAPSVGSVSGGTAHDSMDSTESTESTDPLAEFTVSGEVDVFLTVAEADGWNCIPGADPFTGKPGASCSPSSRDALDKAVFAVFDRKDVPDGTAAVQLARDATLGQLSAGRTDSSAADVPVDQFLPLDSATLSGYCVNTFGTCRASGFGQLGLTLGGPVR